MKKNKIKIRFTSLNLLIDDITNYLITILKKFKDIITNKKGSGILKLTIKLLVLFFLIWLLNIPFYLINKLGAMIIYKTSTTFNEILVQGWTMFISYVYIITSTLIIFDTFIAILNDEAVIIILDDKKKNNALKKKLFYPIIKGIKIIALILLIPLVIILISLFILLGTIIGLITQGASIYSLSIVNIGLIIIIFTITSFIYKWIFNKHKGVKK